MIKIYRYIDLVWEIAGGIIAPPILGILIGRGLDKWFGSDVFSPFLLFLGILAGLWSLVKKVRDIIDH